MEDAPLHSASLRSGNKDKHPQMLLTLGWWSLVLFELNMYKPRKDPWPPCFALIRCAAFWSFLMGKRDNIDFPPVRETCISINFKWLWWASYGRPPRTQITFPINSRVRKTMVHFLIICISACKKLLLNIWTF